MTNETAVTSKAESMLKFLEDKQHMENFMAPEGAYIFMTPEQRRVVIIEINVLRAVLGK